MDVPLFESDGFEEKLVESSELEKEVATSLREKGYAIVEFPDADFEQLAETIISDLQPVLKEAGAQAVSEQRSVRVQDHKHPAVINLAGNVAIVDLLTKVYGRKAFPFQTLNFSVGTQQPVHSDDVHFSSYPKGFMCGVWVALEDIHPDAGPLEFYPRSHQLENVDGISMGQHPFENPNAQPDVFGQGTQIPLQSLWYDALDASAIKPEHFLAKRGQALIWVYNLLHGGSQQRDINRTRWSQVTHYYFEGCDYYTPLSSRYHEGKIEYRDAVSDLRDESLKSAAPQAVVPIDFVPEIYLELHPDVKEAGADPVQHWLNHGFFEHRRYK